MLSKDVLGYLWMPTFVFGIDHTLKGQYGDGDMGTVADEQNCSIVDHFALPP